MWINPLDRVPQVPVDWANHIVYGGLLGLAVFEIDTQWHVSRLTPQQLATVVVFAAAAAKKIVDYIKEGESLAMCLGKTFVTAAWPATWLFA